jgi:two-component system OmpR family response regulator
MFQILIVDDDKNTRHYLTTVLADAGYTPYSASSAGEALVRIKEIPFDLLVLDIMMPGMDGYEFTRLLRDCRYDLPILMLSAKQMPDNIKHGFLAGTDDYMTKPADEDELLLRIKALLRRARIASDHKLKIGKTTLDYDALTVQRDQSVVTLPPKEFLLLYKLLSYPNKIFTRIQLLEDIWGPSTESMESTVSVHINRIRNHFADNPDFQIITIRGLGYKSQIKEAAL